MHAHARKREDLKARAKSLQVDLAARERRRLRERVHLVRVARRRAVGRIRAWAKRRRTEVREHYRSELRSALDRLRSERGRHLSLVRERAELLHQKAKRRFSTVRAARLAELRREIADQKLVIDRERARVKAHRSKARERRAESDDEVRHNIDPDYRPIFDRVRKTIRGGPRRTRTEAFLEWLGEHPDEVLAMQAAQADRDVEQMVREHHEIERERARDVRTAGLEVSATWRGRVWKVHRKTDDSCELTMRAGKRLARWSLGVRDGDWSLGALSSGRPTPEDRKVARAWVDSLDGFEPLDDLGDVPF